MKALIYFKIFIILIHLLSRSFKQIFIQIFKILATTLTAAVVTFPGGRGWYSFSIIPVDSTYLELGKIPSIWFQFCLLLSFASLFEKDIIPYTTFQLQFLLPIFQILLTFPLI